MGVARDLVAPLNDPQPGDAVIYGPQWQRSRVDVTERYEEAVWGVMDGQHPVLYSIRQWREWMAGARAVVRGEQGRCRVGLARQPMALRERRRHVDGSGQERRHRLRAQGRAVLAVANRRGSAGGGRNV